MTQLDGLRAWVRLRRTVLSLAGALVALSLGTVAAAMHARFPFFVVLAVLLVPAAAVWIPTRRLEALPRAVLTVGMVLVLDTLVAELMLATATWSIAGGVLTVTGVSVLVWAGLEIGADWTNPEPRAPRKALALPTSSKEMP